MCCPLYVNLHWAGESGAMTFVSAAAGAQVRRCVEGDRDVEVARLELFGELVDEHCLEAGPPACPGGSWQVFVGDLVGVDGVSRESFEGSGVEPELALPTDNGGVLR